MPTRTARTAWTGSQAEGKGQVELTSSKIGTYEVALPTRIADEAGGSTSPEELLAATHSSCYAMQLTGLLAAAGGTPIAVDVQDDVTLGADPAGGFKITGIHITVRGEVEGMDNEAFVAACEDAKASCPISKALAGVDFTLDAAIES